MNTIALPALTALGLLVFPAGAAALAVDSAGIPGHRAPAAAVEPVPGCDFGARPPAPSVRPDSGSVQPWREGAVYRLDTAPGRVADIVLQPGETLVSVASGDTARWVIGDTESGSGPGRRAHLLVKPTAPGLRTNLVIATDRRVYRLDLASGARAMTSIAWTYPGDELLALQRRKAAAAASAPVAAAVSVERLNFNYAIEGDSPAWRPVRAFDDGVQVFIEFPPSRTGGEAPPLFVIASSGKAELVNYRVRGHYYVVDRLFSLAELRLGEKRQQVVRIVRSDRKHGGWRKGS